MSFLFLFALRAADRRKLKADSRSSAERPKLRKQKQTRRDDRSNSTTLVIQKLDSGLRRNDDKSKAQEPRKSDHRNHGRCRT